MALGWPPSPAERRRKIASRYARSLAPGQVPATSCPPRHSAPGAAPPKPLSLSVSDGADGPSPQNFDRGLRSARTASGARRVAACPRPRTQARDTALARDPTRRARPPPAAISVITNSHDAPCTVRRLALEQYEAAYVLRTSENDVRNRLRRGELNGTRTGRRTCVAADDVARKIAGDELALLILPRVMEGRLTVPRNSDPAVPAPNSSYRSRSSFERSMSAQIAHFTRKPLNNTTAESWI